MANHVLERASAAGPNKSACSLLLAQIRKGHNEIEQVILELRHAEIGWQPMLGCNTIGMLLAHVAAIEGYWVAVASKRFRTDDEIEGFLRKEIGLGVTDDGMPLGPDGRPSVMLEGKGAGYLADLIRAADRLLTAESATWTDAQLEEPFVWGGDTLNLAWILHHPVAHLSYHHGQMNQIRRFYQFANAAWVNDRNLG